MERKVFHCFVDDTALIAGVKRGVRDSIRKWVRNGSTCIYVPLHSIERLQRLQKSNERIGQDSCEVIRWLDEITSQTDTPASNRVHIQGGSDVYATWEEVERFMLPETLLSMGNADSHEAEVENDIEGPHGLADLYIDDFSDKESVSSHDGSVELHNQTPPSPASMYSSHSPGLLAATTLRDKSPKVLSPIGTGRPSHKKTDSSVSAASTASTERPASEMADEKSVPVSLRPFFNHLMWRINKDSSTSLDSFILLTHDPTKQAIAQRFGIRVKRLNQMRDIIVREDRYIRNRAAYAAKQAASNPADQNMSDNNDATPVQESKSKSPAKANGHSHKGKGTEKVKNSKTTPDHQDDDDEITFKRSRQPPTGPQAMQSHSPSRNRQALWDPNSFGRGTGRNARGASRARGTFSFPRGFPGRASRGGAASATAGLSRPPQEATPIEPLDLTQPIDPNTFTRATTSQVKTIKRGRGRLWEPS